MVKNNRIEARVSLTAKRGLLRKAEDCGMNLSEFLEILGRKPFSFIVRHSLINKNEL